MLEKEILVQCRVIAVVGASANPGRYSYRVVKYLIEQGYDVIPVNPNEAEILGKKCYPGLGDIPGKVEVVDVFRSSDKVMPVVEEAVKIGARVVWMQEGVINEEASARAREAGLKVVMDKCILKEHERLVRGC